MLYTKKHLFEALKKAGLPHTYATFLSYERRGIIIAPEGEVKFKTRRWRFYTEAEIKDNVERVRKYRRNYFKTEKATN